MLTFIIKIAIITSNRTLSLTYSFSIHRKIEKNNLAFTEYKRKKILTKCYTTTDDISGLLIYN